MDYTIGWDYISKDWGETLKQSLFYFLINLLPIIGSLIAAGWGLKVTNHAIRKKKGIPGVFEDLGNELIEGLKYTFLVVIWVLPLLFFSFSFYFYPATNYSTIIFMVLIVLALIYGLMLPLQTCFYVKSKEMSDFFKLRAIMQIMYENLGNYLVLILVSIAYLLISIIPVIGSGVSIIALNKLLGSWFAEKTK